MSRVILEGPDGAGKSTLLEYLTQRFPDIPVHPKFVDSTQYTDPTTLYDRALLDMSAHQREVVFYDRHPFISEFIYGPQLRGKLPTYQWTNPRMKGIIKRLAATSLVVWCRPPNETLRTSVTDAEHLVGVSTRIDHIAASYDAMRAMWQGNDVVYDFERPQTLATVYASVQIYIAECRRDFNEGVIMNERC